jgi:hypothetical protein
MNTVEHKVAMYTLAQERRAAGKPVWDRTVRGFRDVLYNNPEDTIAARDGLVGVIKSSGWYRTAEEYGELHTLIDELIDVGNPEIDWDEGYNAQRHLNAMLDAIYDLADQERVWLA